VARTVYHGGYEDLPDAWGEFMGWIEANGHTPATDLWEWYVVGPHLSPNPADWRTELNRPVLD
jgi:effector-binding domain-containing protein